MSYNLLLALYSRTDAIWPKRASAGTKAIYCRSRAIVICVLFKKKEKITLINVESVINAFDFSTHTMILVFPMILSR